MVLKLDGSLLKTKLLLISRAELASRAWWFGYPLAPFWIVEFCWLKWPRVLCTPGLACSVSKSKVMLFEVYCFIYDYALSCSIFARLIPPLFLDCCCISYLPFFLLGYLVSSEVALLLVFMSYCRFWSRSAPKKGLIRLFLDSVPPVVPDRLETSLRPEF